MNDNFSAASNPVSLLEQFRRAFTQPLETPRLIIRPWERSEAALIADFMNADNQAFQVDLFGEVAANPMTVEHITDTVFDHMEQVQRDRNTFCLCGYDKASSRIIGQLRFYLDNEGRNTLCGFVLPSEQEKGYGIEGGAACIQWLRDAKLFTGLHAQAHVDSEASRNILRACGFEETGMELSAARAAGDVMGYDLVFKDQTPAP